MCGPTVRPRCAYPVNWDFCSRCSKAQTGATVRPQIFYVPSRTSPTVAFMDLGPKFNCSLFNIFSILARALCLLDSEPDFQEQTVSYHTLITNLLRFLLEKMNQESKLSSAEILKPDTPSPGERNAISLIYGSEFTITLESAHEEKSKRSSYLFLIQLVESTDVCRALIKLHAYLNMISAIFPTSPSCFLGVLTRLFP